MKIGTLEALVRDSHAGHAVRFPASSEGVTKIFQKKLYVSILAAISAMMLVDNASWVLLTYFHALFEEVKRD